LVSQSFLKHKADLLALLAPDGHMHKYMTGNIFGPGYVPCGTAAIELRTQEEVVLLDVDEGCPSCRPR